MARMIADACGGRSRRARYRIDRVAMQVFPAQRDPHCAVPSDRYAPVQSLRPAPNLLTYGRCLAVARGCRIPLLATGTLGHAGGHSGPLSSLPPLRITSTAISPAPGTSNRHWARWLDPIADKLLVAAVLMMPSPMERLPGCSLWAAIRDSAARDPGLGAAANIS